MFWLIAIKCEFKRWYFIGIDIICTRIFSENYVCMKVNWNKTWLRNMWNKENLYDMGKKNNWNYTGLDVRMVIFIECLKALLWWYMQVQRMTKTSWTSSLVYAYYVKQGFDAIAKKKQAVKHFITPNFMTHTTCFPLCHRHV